MTVDLFIPAPINDVEHLQMRPTETSGQVELRSHSFVTALAPGDVVEVGDGCITGIVSLRPQFVYEVGFHLPKDFLSTPMTEDHPAVRKLDALAERWQRDVEVTQLTAFSMRLSSLDHGWFHHNVRSHEFVKDVEVVRTPVLTDLSLP